LIGGKIGIFGQKIDKILDFIFVFLCQKIGMSHAIEKSSRIEPCLLEQTSPAILDLVASLSAASSRLGTRLHPRSAASLADAVRIMNCYYSNLIEGHNTSLREIERAMAGLLDTTEERRNLQVEARAHIRVQRDIDRRFALDELPEPASADFIRGLHKAFYYIRTRPKPC